MQIEAKQPLKLDPCPPLSNYHVEFWEIIYADTGTESERVFQRDSAQVLEETVRGSRFTSQRAEKRIYL